MDVPLAERYSPAGIDDQISLPGAAISTEFPPKFEKPERFPVLVIAATEITASYPVVGEVE
jgi:hypothetical protein